MTDGNILITGATSGIGKVTAEYLFSHYQHKNLILLGREQSKYQDLIASGIPEERCICFDLANLNDIATLVKDLQVKFGSIEGLIYAAAQDSQERLKKLKPEVFLNLYTVNVFAFIELCRTLVYRKDRTSLLRLLAVSSSSANGSFTFSTAYASSKAALEEIVKSLAPEICPLNAVINAVRFGTVDTPMIAKAKAAFIDNFESYIKDQLGQKAGIIPVAEAAKFLAYLIKEGSPYMTGDILGITGAYAS